MGKKKRKHLRERILFWLAILTPICSVIVFLYERELENTKTKFEIEKLELKTKIASIERNIGDSDYFDVRRLFGGNSKTDNADYILSGNFYADTTNNNWNYKKVSPVRYLRKELNINPFELQMGRKKSFILDSIFKNPEFREYRTEYRFHTWRYHDSISIGNPENKEYLSSSINILVVKKSIAKLVFDVLNQNINSDKKLLKVIDIDTTLVNQVIKGAKIQYDKSSSGLIFSLYVNGMIYSSLLSGDLIELENIQKKSDVFYTKYMRTYNYKDDRVFENGELFFAEKNNNIYLVLIKAYDKQPIISVEKASDINQWLYSLKFLN